MDECFDSLGRAAVFSTLDASSTYSQVEIENEDRQKTVFTSHHGLYLFVRMPFGLLIISSTFERTMLVALSAAKWQLAWVYLDDTVVFSRSAA